MAHYDTDVLPQPVRRASESNDHRHFLNWSVARRTFFLLGDILALVIAHILAVRVTQRIIHLPLTSLNPPQYHLFYVPFFTLVFYLFERYKDPEFRRPEHDLELACKSLSIGFLALTLFNFLVFHTQPLSRYLLLTWFLFAGIGLLITRFTLRVMNERLWRAGIGKKKTILMGSEKGLAGYYRLLSIQRYHGYELLGLISSDASPAGRAEALPLPVLAPVADWEDVLGSLRAELLVVALSSIAGSEELIGRLLQRCRAMKIDVELYSDVWASSNLNLERDQYSGCIRYYSRPQWSLTIQRACKRLFDITVGLVGSVVAACLTPVIGALIKLEDGGPVFYRSAYLDQGGDTKYYPKFRTMRVDADNILQRDEKLRSAFEVRQKLEKDPRVTRVGRVLRKTSLDEFPQFFSILKGDLTFVGPRTIRADEASNYGALLPKLLSAKPGLTGFWQTMGRQTTTYEDRVQMDMFYIDHWSIWLDLVIAAKTVWKVLRTEGAY